MKSREVQDNSSLSSSCSSSSKSASNDESNNPFCLKTRSGRAVKYNTDYMERHLKKK